MSNVGQICYSYSSHTCVFPAIDLLRKGMATDISGWPLFAGHGQIRSTCPALHKRAIEAAKQRLWVATSYVLVVSPSLFLGAGSAFLSSNHPNATAIFPRAGTKAPSFWPRAQPLSHTRTPLHTDAFTHRTFFTRIFKTHTRFYTQTLLHTETFTHRCFYAQTVCSQTCLQTDAYTHKHLYTQTLCTQTLLHAETFTHRHFYTQTPLHTDTFTHRSSYTQTHLHTAAFTHKRFYTQHLYT